MLANLDSPPAGTDAYQWADYIELRALVHPDGCFSKADLDGVQRRVTNANRAFNAEQRWVDATSFVSNRIHAFSGNYPFVLSDNGSYLELSQEALSPEERLYLSLLLSSSLRFMQRTDWPRLTRRFEEISFVVFSHLMPMNSQIRKTWAGAGEDAPYTGSHYEKMHAISRDIRCETSLKERDCAPNDTGDGGIDIIAWHPMSDQREGIPIAFAQCGCSTDDWTHKHLEASPAKLRHFSPMHPWATYYFLPLDLRWADGDWAYKNDLGQAIFVDRLRIVRLASDFGLIDEISPYSSIDEYIRAWAI